MCLGEQNNYPLPQTKKKSLIEIYINPFKYWCKKNKSNQDLPNTRFFVQEAENVDRRCLHKDRLLVITNVCHLGNTECLIVFD